MSALRLVHPTPQDEARYWRQQWENAQDRIAVLEQAKPPITSEDVSRVIGAGIFVLMVAISAAALVLR
jgi:hypothetical protein